MPCTALGGGCRVADPESLAKVLADGLASAKPVLIACEIDPKAATGSGPIGKRDPRGAI
ncbi:MAG TPA: hypothetical protein VGB91_02250 [Rhizomicrobium sp.]